MRVSAQYLAEGLDAKRYGKSWRCVCPSCGKSNEQKFKITSRDDGGAMFHCFAGCSFSEIVASLKEMGLWQDDPKPLGPSERQLHYAESRVIAERWHVDSRRTEKTKGYWDAWWLLKRNAPERLDRILDIERECKRGTS